MIYSGYTVAETGPITVSGSVARFYVDRDSVERVFELHADYEVRRDRQSAFDWRCSSIQRGPNTLVEDSVLIRKGTADCMQRFIEAAQQAHAL